MPNGEHQHQHPHLRLRTPAIAALGGRESSAIDHGASPALAASHSGPRMGLPTYQRGTHAAQFAYQEIHARGGHAALRAGSKALAREGGELGSSAAMRSAPAGSCPVVCRAEMGEVGLVARCGDNERPGRNHLGIRLAPKSQPTKPSSRTTGGTWRLAQIRVSIVPASARASGEPRAPATAPQPAYVRARPPTSNACHSQPHVPRSFVMALKSHCPSSG